VKPKNTKFEENCKITIDNKYNEGIEIMSVKMLG